MKNEIYQAFYNFIFTLYLWNYKPQMYWRWSQCEIFYQVLMLHRFVIGHWCLLAACLRKREPLLYEKENHFSHVTRSSHSRCSSSVFYIMFVYTVWFNFKRTIGILCFETQFGFAFYIDNYKMALYFSLITIYKGVERKWKIHY